MLVRKVDKTNSALTRFADECDAFFSFLGDTRREFSTLFTEQRKEEDASSRSTNPFGAAEVVPNSENRIYNAYLSSWLREQAQWFVGLASFSL